MKTYTLKFIILFLFMIALIACNDRSNGGDEDTVENQQGDYDADEDSIENQQGDSDADLDISDYIYTDETTGLDWLTDIPTQKMDWYDAVDYCANLELFGDDWRLPSISELRSLVRDCKFLEYGGTCRVYDDCISDDCYFEESEDDLFSYCSIGCGMDDEPNQYGAYFPDEMGDVGSKYYYLWSSTERSHNSNGAWIITVFASSSVSTGQYIGLENKTSTKSWATCVRGTFTPPNNEDGDSDADLDISDYIYTDETTGLDWLTNIPTQKMDWYDAVDYCANLDLFGDDWRLPSISELRSLVRDCKFLEYGGTCRVYDDCTSRDCFLEDSENELFSYCQAGCGIYDEPNQYGAYFPDEMGDVGSKYYYLWSSTERSDYTDSAWIMTVLASHSGSADPYIGSYYKTTADKFWATCVRGTFTPPDNEDGDVEIDGDMEISE